MKLSTYLTSLSTTQIEGEHADVELEEGLRASLAMLALEMGPLGTVLDNVDVLAAAASM